MAVRSALIIGGGIAGPATALALRKAGITATVHEAYSESADGVGGLLMIAPNGMAALDLIGAGDAVRAVSEPMPGMSMADPRGRTLARFSGVPGMEPGRIVWRSDLYKAVNEIASAQGIKVEHGKCLAGAKETADGVTAHFTGGTTAAADILVGADGIRSTVRGLIDPAAPSPEYVGLLGFGGGCRGVDVPGEPGTMYFVLGGKAFLGYWTEPDGQVMWFVNLPHPEALTAEQVRSIPAAHWLAELRDCFAGHVPGEALMNNLAPSELETFGCLEILPKVPHWHRGRMVVVGDAAHAPSSSSGQGASLAIESAVQLGRCLRDLPDAPSAFAAYERLRRPRVEMIIDAAARTNRNKQPGAVMRTVMRWLMPLLMKAMNPEKRLAAEQGYRIDWDEPVGTSPAPVAAGSATLP